ISAQPRSAGATGRSRSVAWSCCPAIHASPASVALTEIDGGRLRLPNPRRRYCRQVDEGAIFRAEGHPFFRFGHHRRLAGNGIAQHAETGLRADNKGVETVERSERCLQRLVERKALAHFPGHVARGEFRIVCGLESQAMAAELAANCFVIRKRPVVDEA